MTKKILIATTNPGKIYNYKHALKLINSPIKFIFLDSIDKDIPTPDETGKTYEENALIKAEHYFKHTGMPVISDDAGIELSVLGNVPGIHSARFFREHGNNTFSTLEKMVQKKDPEQINKTATFFCSTIYKDENSIIKELVTLKGQYTFPSRSGSDTSFGYEPIFELPDKKLTFAEMDIETKFEYSPRINAIKKILQKLGL